MIVAFPGHNQASENARRPLQNRPIYLPLYLNGQGGRKVMVQYKLGTDHLEEEEKAGCFDVIVFQMNCYYKCSVALPHGAVVWSEVCDCGISWTYSLTF